MKPGVEVIIREVLPLRYAGRSDAGNFRYCYDLVQKPYQSNGDLGFMEANTANYPVDALAMMPNLPSVWQP